MQPIFPVRSSIIAALLATLWSAGAVAAEGDLLTLTASAGYSYDSNVFRLSSGTNPAGYNSRDDSIWTVTAGADLNKVSGRQRFYGNASAVRSEYQDFSHLSNTGYNAMLGYRLGFGSDSEAGVYYSRGAQLNNYAERVGFYSRNMLESERYGGDIKLRVAGDWLGVASATLGRDENSADALASGNSDIRAYDGGVRYGPRGSKNYIEARYRYSEVNYDGTSGQSSFDYKQREIRTTAVWAPNQVSSFEASASLVRADYDEFSDRDFNSWAGYFGFVWRPTVRSTTGIRLFRDVGSAGDAWGSYARTNGVTLRQDWQATAKIALAADAAYRRRTFEGYQVVGLAAAAGTDQRRDSIYSVGISGNYAVTDKFLTKLSVRNERRQSNVSNYSYSDTILALSGIYRF